MSKPVNDSIRVEPIFDYKNGRRFQILIVNKEPHESFTVHHDMMGREYVKVKLSEADLISLIQEVQKTFISADSDPKIVEMRQRASRLKLVTETDGE